MEEIFELANIKKSEVANLIQSLYSSKPLDKPSDHFKVVEIDEHLLQALEIGDLYFIIITAVEIIKSFFFFK